MIMLASGGTETRTFRQLLLVAEWWADLGLLVQQERQQASDRQYQWNRNNPDSGRGDPAQLVPPFYNANGTVHNFTNSYSAFRTWLLGANATNMAYMLSAQWAALKLDVNFNFVDGNAFDLF